MTSLSFFHLCCTCIGWTLRLQAWPPPLPPFSGDPHQYTNDIEYHWLAYFCNEKNPMTTPEHGVFLFLHPSLFIPSGKTLFKGPRLIFMLFLHLHPIYRQTICANNFLGFLKFFLFFFRTTTTSQFFPSSSSQFIFPLPSFLGFLLCVCATLTAGLPVYLSVCILVCLLVSCFFFYL